MTYSLLKHENGEEDQLRKKRDEYLLVLIDNLEKKQGVVENFKAFCALDENSRVNRSIYIKVINLVKMGLNIANAKEILDLWAKIIKRRRTFEFLDDYVLTSLSFNDPSLVLRSYEDLFKEFGEYFLKFVILLETYKEFDFITNELKNLVKEEVEDLKEK